MKARIMFLSCLTGVIVLFGSYQYGKAAPKTEKQSSLKMGVVSVRKIFESCRRNAQYKEEAITERDKISAELEKLAGEIDAEKAGLKTLKVGSNDYMARVKTILDKQAKLESQREFNNQQMTLKDQRWTEELYKDVLGKTAEVAKQKGLDLVFEKDEIDFPAASANELMLTIRTHKLLYSGGCVDVTDEVMARLDADEGQKPRTKD